MFFGGGILKIELIKELLQQELSPARFAHSAGVAQTAARLAEYYGAQREAARLAGWLHDYARDLPGEKLLALAEKARLTIGPWERKVPVLLHGPVAASLMEPVFGLSDREIKQAIAVHTLGAVKMGLLAKILYVADLIEPGRNYPGVEKLRQIAEEDLDLALLSGFNQTLSYALSRNFFLHPQTVLARNHLLEEIKPPNSG